MATAWAHSNVLDNGPSYIRTNGHKMVLVSTYSAGDSYTLVDSTNKLAEVAMGTADYALSGAANAARTLTITTNGKNATASASATGTPDLHIAFVDTTNSVVLYVTDETSNQAITSGNQVNFPTANLTYTVNQPTLV